MRHYAVLLLIGMFLMALTACETVKGMMPTKTEIQTAIGVLVEGDYTVTLTKDGKVIYVETWTCTKDSNGKLTGCHKEAATPPTPEVNPLVPAPKTLKAP